MLQLTTSRTALHPAMQLEPEGEHRSELFDIGAVAAAARRQWKVIFAFALAGLIIGIVYVATSVPLYSSRVDVLMDRRQARAIQDVSALAELGGDANTYLDSQVEVVKSERIAKAVVNRLDLMNEAEFWVSEGWLLTATVRGLISAARDLLLPSTPKSEMSPEEQLEQRRRITVAKLLGKLNVARVGKTNVITISYSAPSADLAARIANSLADAFIADQIESKFEATRRANAWLHTRLKELREQSVNADLAVQRFRAENGLIASSGRLVSDQQLTELNTQLTVAKSDAAKAEARLRQIRSVMNNRQTEAILSESMGSPIINDFRARYLELSRREAMVAERLGADHERAERLRAEMRDYERLMFEELGRIAGGYESDFRVATARVDSLNGSIRSLLGVTTEGNDKQVTLRELEREAETYKNLYQSFLQRYHETVQQQSLAAADARVITAATPPFNPSHPNSPLMLVISAIFGAIAGTGMGALLEYKDRFFRTGDQVRTVLGLEFFGNVPKLVPSSQSAAPGWVKPRTQSASAPMLRHVLDAPLSEFAETLRSASLAIDVSLAGKQSKVVGVVSVLPGEGKTLIAKNLATLLAHQGSKTLLIDADLRCSGLSTAFLPNTRIGLLEVLADPTLLRDAIHVEQDSGLIILPSTHRANATHTSRAISGPAMESLLARSSEMFEYIILDLPPIGPVVDARAAATHLDAFVLAIEWGRTPRNLVKSALVSNEAVRSKCIGAILNNVEMNRLRLYEEFPGASRDYGQYLSSGVRPSQPTGTEDVG